MRHIRAEKLFVIGLILAGSFVCDQGTVLADEAATDKENPHVWRPQTRSVAVFKNGLGFFMREGDVRLRDGWCIAGEVPPAAFGTLAIYSHGEQSVVDVVGSGPGEVVEFDGRDAPADIAAKRTRLEASRQIKVELSYKHLGQDQTASGTLVSVGPDFVVLEDGNGNHAVPLAGITKMQVLDMPLRIHIANEAEQAPEQETLGMAYLRKGITWIPDYTLKGTGGEVPVTAAINVAHTRSEREADRKLAAYHVPNNAYFDLVTLDGKLEMHNYEVRTVEIVIHNPVPGKPLVVSDGGALQTDPTKLQLVEREGAVSWRLKLEPGEHKTLTYQYERYVRSN